jgi:hypothetical protein
MSFIDAAIPGIMGLVLLIWPQAMFVGARVNPDAKKIRLLRGAGALLLFVAAVYLVARVAGA